MLPSPPASNTYQPTILTQTSTPYIVPSTNLPRPRTPTYRLDTYILTNNRVANRQANDAMLATNW